jgi:integrase
MASAGIRKTPTGRYKVWWRLDDASQGSQSFDTRDAARDFKHDLLVRLARGSWVDPRLGKQIFETWAREWWDGWSTNPDHSPRTLQAAEARLRRHLLPSLGHRQLRAITVSVVRQWQNELRGRVGYDTVMACRSLLYRILQAAEDDRRIEVNPVRKVPAPKPPVDPAALLGRAKRRAYTPEEFGYLLAGTPLFYRDHFICLVGTGLRAGELLGLRARRVDLDRRQLEVLEVRYDAGRFGSGYKDRPKSPASIRVVPLAAPVAEAIARRFPPDGDSNALVFTGPGGSNGLPRGARSAMSRHGLLRVYKHALLRVADPVASLPYTPRRVLAALRDGGPQTVEQLRGRLRGRTPRPVTVLAALDALQAAGLAREDQVGRWVACDPPTRDDLLGQLRLRGPHDLRHTFATWLEDAGIPARVIDELMGHASGRRDGGAPTREGSLIGTRYRWTTPEMEARVVAAIEQRLAIALKLAEGSQLGRVLYPSGRPAGEQVETDRG